MTTTQPTTHPGTGLRLLTTVLAVACGVTVANLYYAQPLLDLIARDLDVTEGTATLIVTFTQVGYAVGLVFVLPLGDLLENRRLVTRVLLGTVVALVAAALSPTFTVFAVVSVLVGLTSVVAQILVPFAAHLASDHDRGRVVGQVMSGLLLGILLARSVASLLADWLGWRAIFGVSAALTVALVVALHRLLPERRPDHVVPYRTLLASVGALVRDEPVLRARALCQASMFGAFTAYWTAVAFELVDEHGLDQTQIALFALIGAGGAAAAPLGGRLADRGHGRTASAGMLLLAAASCLLAGLGESHLVLLALGGVLLDLAVQCHQVMSQHEIYGLRPEARARINTVYMTTVFAGGAVSSAITGLLHAAYGWQGVCWFAAALPLLGLLVWTARLRPGARLPGRRERATLGVAGG